ncbi:helix-turn-helix transcriptional regulator [Pseudoduganella chitinolytica]|uniref:Helix-turn-helix transcriptional regulator n=1 Tax=Pseudoduganella chitinolytica TaxID=34070 RepID=A0ABY8BFZ6_9BURK|nr:helix-turn-helix transcriptional regulator [Pseudoduganella chitinolytica]WEF33913.1 helix-turn-helix transcriptional regulator [Pseudoduganella chitinolytica]
MTTPLLDYDAWMHTIYSGASAPERWPDILQTLGTGLGASKALLFTPMHCPAEGGFHYAAGIPEDFLGVACGRCHQVDLWTRAGLRAGFFVEGNVGVGAQLVPDGELLRSDWYRNYLSLGGLAQMLVCVVSGVGQAGTLPVLCSFFRDVHEPPFTLADRERLALLAPHLSRSIGIMRRLLQCERTALAGTAALDRLRHGVLFIDEGAKVVFENKAANALLNARDALLRHNCPYPVMGYTVGARDVGCQETLAATLAGTLQGDPASERAIVVPRPSGRTPLIVKCAMAGPSGNSFAAATIFIVDMGSPTRVEAELLARAFNLSRGEARVAVALASAGAVGDIAQTMCLSTNTVKTHLKNIYAKTGITHRSELMKAIVALSDLTQHHPAG